MIKNLIFISTFIVILCSCDPGMIYDSYQKTENGNWSWEDKKVFKVTVPDSIRFYNLLINIRHTTAYPKSNLFVFITSIAPNGQSLRDTVEIQVADSKGKWTGNGFGDIKLISRMYKRAAKFRYNGEYTFIIEQGMRIPEVPVTDVGLRIEKFVDLK